MERIEGGERAGGSKRPGAGSASSHAGDEVEVALTLQDGYRFEADFLQPGVPTLLLDEPQPLGEGRGPNATRLLAAAVGNCLSASALFCLRKARVPVAGMRTGVRATLTRNEAGRIRVAGLRVSIEADVPDEDKARSARCIDLFEDFCLVTESVRDGVSVDVDVEIGAPAATASG
ncbi:MAG TPA: OsmC family protein [Longimicrobiales bacterium]|nr:OsmC family protein [Longimicrobiales bacterium]